MVSFRQRILTLAIRPAIALLLACMVFVNGCSDGPQQHSYRIGLGPWVGFGPLYLAQEKGFFRDAGINVELIVLTGIAERNSALKSGRIDALAAPVDYFVLSAGNHLETTIVMAIDESVGGDGIVARKDITKITDLRGKKVAFQRGLPSEFFLRALLQRDGVKLDELISTDMETAQAGAAFIAGNVDAAVVWEPWLSKAQEAGSGHVLASTKDFPNLIVDCLAFTKENVARSPDDVQKIVNAIYKAIDFWKENPDEANKIMAPHFQLDPAKYALILSGAKFTDQARNQSYFGTEQNPGVIFGVAQTASNIWLSAGVVKTSVTPKAIIATQFVLNWK